MTNQEMQEYTGEHIVSEERELIQYIAMYIFRNEIEEIEYSEGTLNCDKLAHEIFYNPDRFSFDKIGDEWIVGENDLGLCELLVINENDIEEYQELIQVS